MINPYISWVVVARNDNYGGDFLYRIQIFINVLTELVEKYNINSELVIVEWNPLEDKLRLKDALNWPKNLEFITIRIIEVPNEIHKKFRNSDKIAVFEMIGKNVGIRRANGDYILDRIDR